MAVRSGAARGWIRLHQGNRSGNDGSPAAEAMRSRRGCDDSVGMGVLAWALVRGEVGAVGEHGDEVCEWWCSRAEVKAWLMKLQVWVFDLGETLKFVVFAHGSVWCCRNWQGLVSCDDCRRWADGGLAGA
ncbi:hypothetical protein M0R45_037133 [Rubus argutus]|uniref:Uncharacterized protein n=1 Tax=Rubus argutus TaxID=59490 RepID=A0AAW1VY68_RUBAR